ncbi:MAG: hypothetical protein FWC82_03570 [Firmicutes bacterium]|nr:hypothetical protein [Bacillota bacterium]
MQEKSETNNTISEACFLADALDEVEREEAHAPVSDASLASPEKKSMFARIRGFFASKNPPASKEEKEKAQKKKSVGASLRTLLETNEDDIRKFNEFLGAMELHLDKVEGQNEHLLRQLGTLEKNNTLLLEQVQVLTKNNNQLTEQYNNMKKREKVAKIMAIIAATFSIGLAVFNVIFNIILPNI